MEITLYSIGCASCRVLEAMLNGKQMQYNVVSDVSQMDNLGIKTVPQLEVDGERMGMAQAVKWLRGGKHEN